MIEPIDVTTRISKLEAKLVEQREYIDRLEDLLSKEQRRLLRERRQNKETAQESRYKLSKLKRELGV